MTPEKIRVGIVGAGGNVRLRHAPGFKAIEGVELVSVSNRTRESGERAAEEFGISKVYDNWLDLVQADDTDAICIGTWPYLHAAITIAALEYDKHVLTEARMAMNAEEAHAMLEASRASPHLVAQIVPAPMTLKVDQTVQEMISQGYLGQVLAVDMRNNSSAFLDVEAPLHWRQSRDLSGLNIMMMGIWYEMLMRWIGPATKVMAMTNTFVKQRRDADGRLHTVDVPDHADVICEMACGARAQMRFSSVTGLAPANEVWLFGADGTIKLDADKMELYAGKRGDAQLSKVDIDPQKQGDWRVEEEFINAIRGIEQVKLTTFEDGVKYMEFTEAVTRSAQSGEAVSLPL